jgi:aspartyl-tRNA(Asn)/glutamyl-tRNA(Gln) amidotransferase subunit A
MATDVATCARMMRALAPRMPERELRSLAGLEVGVAWLDRAEPEVAQVVEAVAAVFPRRRELELPWPTGVLPAFQREIADVHRDLFPRHRELYGRAVATLIERCLAVDDERASAAREARSAYRATFAAALEPVDLLIVPTLPIAPPPREADPLAVRDRMTEFTFPLNAVGAPALALPCGRTRDGHPVSLQLIGRPGADDLVLAAGALLERELAS